MRGGRLHNRRWRRVGFLFAGLRPAPATSQCRSNSRSWVPEDWRGGSGCGGRRKYVPVGSVAPSMALTPPQPDPPRLRQLPAICRNHILLWWVSTLVDTVDPRHAWMTRSISDRCVDQGRHLPTAAGICQRWGGVGVRGVSRMDAAAKPPWTGLRRPRTPAPPRHPTECTLLLLLLLLLLPASGRHYRRCRAASPANKKPRFRGVLCVLRAARTLTGDGPGPRRPSPSAAGPAC